MIDIVISFLTFVLIIVSLFLVLVILMQRANSNAGMGSAFGGGVTESAFGADTANVLTRATKWSSIAFFAIALGLYLLYMSKDADSKRPVDSDLPDIPVATSSPDAVDALREAASALESSDVDPAPPATAESLGEEAPAGQVDEPAASEADDSEETTATTTPES